MANNIELRTVVLGNLISETADQLSLSLTGKPRAELPEAARLKLLNVAEDVLHLIKTKLYELQLGGETLPLEIDVLILGEKDNA